jgi:hypothetical protein
MIFPWNDHFEKIGTVLSFELTGEGGLRIVFDLGSGSWAVTKIYGSIRTFT